MRHIWRFFSSVYLTIVLAALICAVGAWGSIVSMSNPRFFNMFDREVLFPLLSSIGTGYLGLTLWVYALIILTALFAVNTTVCTVDKVLSIIGSRRPWQSLFPHIVHVGFLIALLGHLVGSVWGFRSYGHVLRAGEAMPVPHEAGLYVRLDRTETRVTPEGDLDYVRTDLTILGEDGKEVLSGEVGFNSPLIYKGIAFYHVDHGKTPAGLVLDVNGQRVTIGRDGSFTAPDGSRFRLGDIYPDFALDGAGRPYSRSDRFSNPHVEIMKEDGASAYLDISAPGTGVRHGEHAITLSEFVFTPYAVLTINKDPGIAYIIVGSTVLVAGMVFLLFFRGDRAELVRLRPGPRERTD